MNREQKSFLWPTEETNKIQLEWREVEQIMNYSFNPDRFKSDLQNTFQYKTDDMIKNTE